MPWFSKMVGGEGFAQFFGGDRATLRCRFAPDCKILWTNDACANLVGIPLEELIGKNILDFFPPTQQQRWKSYLLTLIPGQWMKFVELAALPKNRFALMLWWNSPTYENDEVKHYDSIGEVLLLAKHNILEHVDGDLPWAEMSLKDLVLQVDTLSDSSQDSDGQ